MCIRDSCGSAGKSDVKETRRVPAGAITRRRRCTVCGRDFRTSEQVTGVNVRVRKSDGRIVPFLPEQIRKAIIKAVLRPREFARLDEVVDGVSNEAIKQADENGIVTSALLGNMTQQALRNLDPVSYVRYALVQTG